MKVGDLVRVVANGRYCEVTEVHKEESHSTGRGHCWVGFLDDGSEGTFTLDEVEAISGK